MELNRQLLKKKKPIKWKHGSFEIIKWKCRAKAVTRRQKGSSHRAVSRLLSKVSLKQGRRNCRRRPGAVTGCSQLSYLTSSCCPRAQALLATKCHPGSFTGKGCYDGTCKVATVSDPALFSDTYDAVAGSELSRFPRLKEEGCTNSYPAKVMKGNKKSQCWPLKRQGMALPQIDIKRIGFVVGN